MRSSRVYMQNGSMFRTAAGRPWKSTVWLRTRHIGEIIGGRYKCDGIIKKSVSRGSTRGLNIAQNYFPFLLLMHLDAFVPLVFKSLTGTVDLTPQIFAYDTLEE